MRPRAEGRAGVRRQESHNVWTSFVYSHARLEQPVRDCFIFGFFPRVVSIAARGRRSERGDKVFFQTGELQFHLGEFASKHA